MEPEQKQTKSNRIYRELRNQIATGQLTEGDTVPTERELSLLYDVSRPTVSKALQRLQHEGLIVRRAGSGTFVRRRSITSVPDHAHYFGLLIPKLGITEIFEPICARIAQLSRAHNFHLLWGDSAAHDLDTAASDLEAGCLRYIEQGVDGLFFVPLELVPAWHDVNMRIVQHLQDADMPVVLLDSDYLPYPQRGSFDLVGIDNVRAGYRAAHHYLEQDARRVDFLYRPFSAYTVQARLQGCRLALDEVGITMEPQWIHEGDPESTVFMQQVLRSGATNIVCANDATAIAVMQSCTELGVSIPHDVRLIGFDNVRYSEFARVPLTTFRQPCSQIGELAVSAMLLSIQDRKRPLSTVLAEPDFILRQSSIIPR